MNGRRGIVEFATRVAAPTLVITAVLVHAAPPANGDVIVKTLDRKFPIGKYCPLESRAAAGADLSFVATTTSVRITFSSNNFKGPNWNALHLDNISVQLKSVFDTHLLVSPGFDDCYNPSTPPGQTTGGMLNAPSYDFNAAGTTEISLDLFPTNTSGWTGSHLGYDATSTAPTSPSTGTGTTGGSLALGAQADGAVTVSASKVITGITVGQQYVVFGWWKIQDTDRLTITIDNPCPDPDGDGYVDCTGCDVGPGQTCGDCNPANAHCGANCTDGDGDGWCVTTDCNDSSATCNSDCVTNLDADATPDCRDTCIDVDRDGYGTAGGGGNTCLGADCNAANPYCHATCVDGDGDGRCQGVDCNDANPAVGNALPEVNDYLDQQCPGDDGYGVIDETSGNSGFTTPGNKTLYSWPAQSGASSYRAVRSPSPTFPSGCTVTTTSGTSWSPFVNPPAGGVHYYLNRPLGPSKGSWGQKSGGVERAVICGEEAACGNGIDDDADTLVDCLDGDCGGTPPCRIQTFAFTDTTSDDIAEEALAQFFQSATAGASDYIFFQIVESPTRTVAWCSQNAAFHRTSYLAFAPSSGSAMSGSWNKWRKSPLTGNAWQGPFTAAYQNVYGNECFGNYTWCSEQFPTEPQNAIFPNRTNDCEAYDLATGFCGNSTGSTWQLTIRIASTRMGACGF